MTIVEKWRLMMSSFEDIRTAIIEKDVGLGNSGYNSYANAVRRVYSGSNVSEYEYPQSTGDIASDAINLVRWCGMVKNQIRLAIAGGGVECDETVPLSEYGNKIRRIAAKLTMPNTYVSVGQVGDEVNVQLEAKGGKPPYTWSTSEAAVMADYGLTLSSGGVVSGIVSENGADTTGMFRISVTDSEGKTVAETFRMVMHRKSINFTVSNYFFNYDGTPKYATVICNELPDLDFTVTYRNMATKEIEEPINPGTYSIVITLPNSKIYRIKQIIGSDRIYIYR